MSLPRDLGQLRASGYQPSSVKDEMRRNLIDKIRRNETLFPGIVGYDDTVIPQVENAVLSGQDIVLLGERGQAKTRLARSLVSLLDPSVPVVAGSEVNDDPMAPISRFAISEIAEKGDATPIAWIRPDSRYGEKLATPDITIADLIGEVDPIKVAEGRYLSDEMTIHYGLLPRTNRGVFCINELPDLAERIQVGLLNIMEERDVQIRGYKVRLELDLFVVASANPEDYTNRGRIITPLKDRFGTQIRTHYPRAIGHEIDIMESERAHYGVAGVEVRVPGYMKEIIAEITHAARRSSEISQRSGVSVRVSITNFENVVANAIKRAVRQGESVAVPRISDLIATRASTGGKIELESFGESRDDRVLDRIVQTAVLAAWARQFSAVELKPIVDAFEAGSQVEASDHLAATTYIRSIAAIPPLREIIGRVVEDDTSEPTLAAATEFVLEGLHLNRKLNKDRVDGTNRYRG
ncbi:MAG: magnesium chelatase [Chloroflexota bacterium]|nr:MAG: magnesium chelatase [Chloroflexota bacterium]